MSDNRISVSAYDIPDSEAWLRLGFPFFLRESEVFRLCKILKLLVQTSTLKTSAARV